MRKDCWIQSGNIQRELEAFFSEVDDDLSSYYEEHPNTSETHLDGMLIGLLTSKSFERYANRINAERERSGLRPISLKIKGTPITSKERTHGADIGIVARLNIPGEHELTKAALVQSKRLHPNLFSFSDDCVYPELFKEKSNGDTPPQWERMLGITSSSFYFLYNPERVHIKRTNRTIKTRVITAQTIAGMVSRRRPFTVQDAAKAKTFASWMVEEFICCNVGDPRDDVVATALGQNQEFSVRHSIEVTMESGEIRQESFSR
jgi:hypothetical protein